MQMHPRKIAFKPMISAIDAKPRVIPKAALPILAVLSSPLRKLKVPASSPPNIYRRIAGIYSTNHIG